MLFESRDIHLVLGYTDMRKSIDTLSIKLASIKDINIFDGSMFVFCNRRQTIIKVLYYDRNGFCLFQKRLDKIHFDWPKKMQDTQKIRDRELRWLLDGLVLGEIDTSGDGEYTATA